MAHAHYGLQIPIVWFHWTDTDLHADSDGYGANPHVHANADQYANADADLHADSVQQCASKWRTGHQPFGQSRQPNELHDERSGGRD